MKDVSSPIRRTGTPAAAAEASKRFTHSAFEQTIDDSPRQVAQRQRMQAIMGTVAGKAAGPRRQQAAIGSGVALVLQRSLWVGGEEVFAEAVEDAARDELKEEQDRLRVVEILRTWAGDQKHEGRDFKDWRAAIRAARRRLPSQTIGFELEDSAMEYTGVKTNDARKHRPQIIGFDLDDMEMVVGADSHPQGYSDLEIRSQPLDISRPDQMNLFLDGYLEIYEQLFTSIEGLKKNKQSQDRGQLIVPQLTVSIPLARLGDLVDASLFPLPHEEIAMTAFNTISKDVDTKGLASAVVSLAKFLNFYLSGVWENVSNALNNKNNRPRTIVGGRAQISDKKLHSLFLKEVERNGVAINGVVDLYTQACEALSGSGVAINSVVEEYLIGTLEHLGKTDLIQFTKEYVKYLDDQAKKVKSLGPDYKPEAFRPLQKITMKNKIGSDGVVGEYELLLPELEGLRDSTIEPNQGQEHSVFIEERRLNSEPRRGVVASEAFAERLEDRKTQNVGYTDEKEPKPFAKDAVDRLRIMVDFYRKFLQIE